MEDCMFRGIIVALLLLPTCVFAGASRGEQLVQKLWKDLKEGNIEKIRHYTSWKFQAVHGGHVGDRKGFLEIQKQIHVLAYELSNITASMSQDTIVVTYQAKVTSQIGQHVIETQGLNMSVFRKIDGKWTWMANYDPAIPPG